MKLKRIILFSLALIIPLAGCRTSRQQQESQRQQWEDTLSRRVVDIENRVFELENSLAVLKRQLDTLDRQLTGIENTAATGVGQQKTEMDALRKEMDAARRATEKKIEIILEEVAKENERLLRSLKSTRGSAAYAQGYEHVVKTGETISTIARQYKVTVDAIVDANQLSNPNAIRVGQTLFIPQ
ncbi:MAG: LysM peptidoglycan-binding domain-containing protein [Candidatus Euphemobacter frigidus]|nr:LysM peptidoglycan-binding domain-containing protein [Candidatus Euphemobacter frigidus]MDP8276782.1 LysM peptidoglycan-binding domain-containing protein [Candidatus Euphemobacter frigidus]